MHLHKDNDYILKDLKNDNSELLCLTPRKHLKRVFRVNHISN